VAAQPASSVSQKRITDKFAEFDRVIDELRSQIPPGLKETLSRLERIVHGAVDDCRQMESVLQEQIDLLNEKMSLILDREYAANAPDESSNGTMSGGSSSKQSRNTMLQVCTMEQTINFY
jgi:hypothetical protein